MNDVELLRGFEEASLPAEAFHHREHVRVAWLYLRREPAGLALERFAADLRRLAASYGKPGLYHATVTWAWLLLVGERASRSEAADSERFLDEHPELLAKQPGLLERYYRQETLQSDLARRVFLMPDRLAS